MTVSTDPNKHPHIQINLDITFPNVPCYMLYIRASTEVAEYDEEDTIKHLKYSHLDKDGGVVEEHENTYPMFKNIELKNAFP